ncbi:MAG: response regulator transcription factor [Solirubrobacterales bacterium]|nr:response regulator transcription factor [Solirubrobacterales bacterium]
MDDFAGEARRVLVVDDSEVVRTKMRMLLQDDRDLELVGEAADGESGVAMAADLRPDLVIMDLRMPGMSGIKATWELGSRVPECSVLVLTVSEDPEDVADAIMAGATGYVVKGAGDDEMRATIHRVAAGERVLAPKVASALVERTRPHDSNGDNKRREPPPPSEEVREVARASNFWPNLAVALVAGALLTAIGLGDEIADGTATAGTWMLAVANVVIAFMLVNAGLLARRR